MTNLTVEKQSTDAAAGQSVLWFFTQNESVSTQSNSSHVSYWVDVVTFRDVEKTQSWVRYSDTFSSIFRRLNLMKIKWLCILHQWHHWKIVHGSTPILSADFRLNLFLSFNLFLNLTKFIWYVQIKVLKVSTLPGEIYQLGCSFLIKSNWNQAMPLTLLATNTNM